tara:strand:- start:8570 stop:9400 length:831 start_codon:yes stop_codon:yes gene_type:complete
MKNKHNKKRNTAFIYEALIKEATVAMLRGEGQKKRTIVSLMKKHFKPGSELYKELQCYRSLYENQNLDREISQKIIKEAKIAQRLVDPHGLFKQQTALIKDINTEVSSSVFGNYVPNYKTLASIAQMFSDKLSPKNAVILEGQIVENMTNSPPEEVVIEDIDSVVVSKFVQKFNDKYNDELLEEQKELLSYYITSFSDNALELKIFLNEEISRLKEHLIEAKRTDEIREDETMVEKTTQVIAKLDSYTDSHIDESLLKTVMKTQKLVKEICHGHSG